MVIHDDADMAVVVEETVAALHEGANHIGKADRMISAEQIARVEQAIAQLQNALDRKKGL
jgi:hypothetical protein